MQEVFPDRIEYINQHPLFQAKHPMEDIGRNVNPIPIADNLHLISNCKFEFSTVAKGGLGMKVRVWSTNGSRLKLYFHHHDLIVPAENLPGESGTKLFPFV